MRTRTIVLSLLACVTLAYPAGAPAHARSTWGVTAAPPPPVYPWPIGRGPRYQPPAANVAVLEGRPVGGMRCANGHRFAVHVELFAHRKVVIVPPRIGVARRGCSYPVRTNDPTGVVDVLASRRSTLGDLFTLWGRTLTPTRLLSFPGRVSVFVNGKQRVRDPRRIALTRHLQVVVEVGAYVAPHATFLFPKGRG